MRLLRPVLFALLCVYPAFAAPASEVVPRAVTAAELLEAMQSVTGYDGTVTTNSFRFQLDTILRLVTAASAQDPTRRPLFIDYETWRHAYLLRHRLKTDQAPLQVRLAYEHRQSTLLDYRRENVIKRIAKGPEPNIAVNVKAWWPKEKGTAKSYVYVDEESDPVMWVRNKRIVTYRLLAFSDMIIADDMHGMHGRPKSGLLGLLFKVIGEGRAVYARMAVSSDGLMVARGQVRRGPVSLTTTVTIHQDGHVTSGVP